MMTETLEMRTDARMKCSAERAIDLVHLARMTLGDRSLEREVLQLFARQSSLLRARMGQARRGDVGALAHTLKGSAQGVGAWPVAAAAEAVECAAAGAAEGLPARLADLDAAVAEARAAIDDLLRTN